jgi:hypothetical protein
LQRRFSLERNSHCEWGSSLRGMGWSFRGGVGAGQRRVTAGFALKGAGLKTGAYNDGGAAAVAEAIGPGATFMKQVDSMGVGEGILGLSLCAVGERIRARGWARGGREPGRNWAPAMGRRKRPPQKAAATKGVDCDSHGTW